MATPFAHQKGENQISTNNNKMVNSHTIDTYGGKVQFSWDEGADSTLIGPIVFFVEYLKTASIFDDFVKACPLVYTSNNAPKIRDVLGTILLSVLYGHKRYAHITAIRSDNVVPGLLGMSKIVSEDAVRRALITIGEEEGIKWLQNQLDHTYRLLLNEPWILDIDSTVKPIYGTQEGAEIGYNPKKPGRPSHVYHTYMIGNLRMVLDVEVQGGKSSSAKAGTPRLWEFIDQLSKGERPYCIRGDIGFGNDAVIVEAEKRKIDYLFKLKCTTNVKVKIAKLMESGDWERVQGGWEAIESYIQLMGWKNKRRIIVLRRKLPNELMIEGEKAGKSKKQKKLIDLGPKFSAYEYGILVTNMLEEDLVTISQMYRDRADSENVFDELKNQWGWGGYVTQDLKRCRLIARIVALVYNWWNLYSRLAVPDKHIEAITSRPVLLHGVGKVSSHAGQKHLKVKSIHGKADKITKMLSCVSGFLQSLKSSAEQLSKAEIWIRILSRAFGKFLQGRILSPPKILPV